MRKKGEKKEKKKEEELSEGEMFWFWFFCVRAFNCDVSKTEWASMWKRQERKYYLAAF